MKLIYKLTGMAAIVILPLVAAIVIFTSIAEESFERNIRERHQEFAGYLATEMDSFFENFQKNVFSFLYNYETAGFDDEMLREYFTTILVQFGYVRIMTVADRDGKVKVQVHSPEEVSPSVIS